MKNKRLATLTLISCLLLTACAAPVQPAPSLVTLPPVIDDIVAPIGDAALAYEETVALYLPSRDGQRLVAQYETLTLNRGRHPAMAVVRALLDHPGNEAVLPLGGSVTLQLATSDPIELSGEVCTVHLAPSALLLDHDDLYAACMGLTNTLCELPGIRAVNVLVGDQAVALDVADYLPMGSLSPHAGTELPVLWSQVAARRVPVGDNPADVPLTAAATMYYPLSDGSGIIPEVRTLSFAGQQPAQLMEGLFAALAVRPAEQAAAALPSLSELLLFEPAVVDLAEGGRMAQLHFLPALESELALRNLDLASFAASLSCTLLTFVPSLSSVQLYIGEQPLTTAYSPAMGTLLFPGGVMRRSDFSPYMKAAMTLYLPRAGKLEAVTYRLSDDEAYHPRTLLRTLMAGPTATEQVLGFTPLLPDGLSDADILGISAEGDTLLVNFSARTADLIRESDLDQHLMCRGLVSALCKLMHVRRVRFFFGGNTAQALGGPIFWGGEFLYSPDLTDTAGGV